MDIEQIRKLIRGATQEQINEINKLPFPVPPVCTAYWSDEDFYVTAALCNKDKFSKIMGVEDGPENKKD